MTCLQRLRQKIGIASCKISYRIEFILVTNHLLLYTFHGKRLTWGGGGGGGEKSIFLLVLRRSAAFLFRPRSDAVYSSRKTC